MAAVAETGAEGVAWDLSDLYSGTSDPSYDRDAADALESAKRFRERYEGTLHTLDASRLLEATQEFERITGLAYGVRLFPELEFEAEATEERGALLQQAQERQTLVRTELLFFDLEWSELDDAAVEALLADPLLERYRYALASRRRFRGHLLSAPEERVAAQKAITGIDTWRRLHTELLSRLKARIDEREVTFTEALTLLETATDRDVRRHAAEAINAGLEPELRMRAFVVNTVVNDRAVEDRLRDYPTWISAFNLQHRISDDAVDSLVGAVVARFELARRHFRLRARLLGLDRLAAYDLVAPTGDEAAPVPWREAAEIILGAYEAFTPEAREIVARFFDGNWIDAAVRPGKGAGAFCVRPVPGGHPYVLTNYTGSRRDVAVLAHELGHGLHGVLAAPVGYLNMDYPLTVAETASVFGEALTYDALRAREEDERRQLDLIVSQIDTLVRTALGPIAGNRFEHALHTARRAEGDLAVDRINELWLQELGSYWGDAVAEQEIRATWWSYVPHFVTAPGYQYPYAFGLLLSFSIYRRWTQEGASYVEPILDLLRAGATKPPEELVRGVGFDLADPDFWNHGLDAIEALVDEAERLADRLGL